MNIFNIFGRKSQAARTPEIPRSTEVQQKLRANSNGTFHVEAKTLDEYHQLSWAEKEASQLRGNLSALKEIQKFDNTRTDLDSRPGHFVSKNKKTEFHPDSGELFRGGAWANVKTDESGATVQKDGATLTVDSNRGEATVVLPHPSKETSRRVMSPDAEIETARYLRTEETFMVSPDGKLLPLPPVAIQSISEAKANDSKNKSAQRAESVLSSVLLWEDQTQALDGIAADRNSEAGMVVVPRVGFNALKDTLAKDRLFRNSSFEVERTSEGFFVADNADSYGGGRTAGLMGQVGEQQVTGNFIIPGRGYEKVEWDREKNTLTYQKYSLYE